MRTIRWLEVASRCASYTAMAVVALGLSGCVTYPKPTASAPVPVSAATSDVPASPPEYRLRANDEIEIKFFHNTELNESMMVRPDGRISLQLIGDILVAGMTPAQLKQALLERYTPILKYPEPTVIVRKLAPQRIYVGGEVQAPGTVGLDTNLSALQAIFQVGGFKFNAYRSNVVVFRNTVPNRTDIIVLDLDSQLEPSTRLPPDCKQASGNSARLTCDQAAMVHHGDLLLRPDDIVFVPQSSVGRLSEFIEKNFNKIVPLYGNMGLTFNYLLNTDSTTTVRTAP